MNDMLRIRGREQDKLQGARFFERTKKMTMRTVPTVIRGRECDIVKYFEALAGVEVKKPEA